MNDQPVTLTQSQRFVVSGLMVATIAACIWYYATPATNDEQKTLAYRSLQLLSFLIPLAFALVDIPGVIRRIKQSTHRTTDMIIGGSMGITFVLLLLTLAILFHLHIIPAPFLPWLLPTVFFLGPFVVAMGHNPLRDGYDNTIVKHAINAVVCGVLTWGQLALVHHFDTWLLLLIGVVPIPVLVITSGLTGIFALFSILVLVCAGVLYPLRLAFVKVTIDDDHN